MNRELKRVLVAGAGVSSVTLGFVGLALPFLQGFVLIAVGVILLSLSSSRIRTWMKVRTVRYPKLHAAIERTEAWILRVIGPVDTSDDDSADVKK